MRGADDLEVVHMGERTRYEPGTFCWVGLATSDPGRAKAFYTGLFGWHAEDLEAGAAGAYTPLRHGGRDVATLYLQQPEARAAGAPPHWTSYISVEDAEATAALAGELGGAAVFRAPFDVLDAGRVAAIRDPTGAIVSLWQPRALIGATLVNDVGALCWNELATTDVERAKSFFGELLGWQYETDDSGYVSIINAGRRNGGMREQTERERGTPPSWLPYFSVESGDEAARQAEQLDGHTLLPKTEIHIGRFAVIADRHGRRVRGVRGRDRSLTRTNGYRRSPGARPHQLRDESNAAGCVRPIRTKARQTPSAAAEGSPACATPSYYHRYEAHARARCLSGRALPTRIAIVSAAPARPLLLVPSSAWWRTTTATARAGGSRRRVPAFRASQGAAPSRGDARSASNAGARDVAPQLSSLGRPAGARGIARTAHAWVREGGCERFGLRRERRAVNDHRAV
jgi:uncharacterized protein